jgi:NAD(P)-dependent dehydrogenase (short-subunit alcohol dehydrogenase family)
VNIAIAGGSGGIGGAFVGALAVREDVGTIHATFNRRDPAVNHPKVRWQPMDATQEASVQHWTATLGPLDWLINTVGMLHESGSPPEKSVRRFEPSFFLKSIAVNTVPLLLLAKHAEGCFEHGRPAVFATVSARVGSIEDNRLGGWYSYRASKAALNMCVKSLSIEWKRTRPNVSVAALHPGTTNTDLSKPFLRNVPREKLFTPAKSAGLMLEVIRRLTPENSGRFWSYDGEQIPW